MEKEKEQKVNDNPKKSTFIHGLSFSERTILLDDNKLLGVTHFDLKKSSTGYAELELKLIVRVKGLDY
ncbi:hypothetical protein [Enterococcus sp. AZ128]|uniref:hypothetical protein n=1 Tax=unclassified Enterococcus TaxID=2608891 RepID=UPI003F1F71D4